MKSVDATRRHLEPDQRALVANLGSGEWQRLLLLTRAAKRAGLHIELDVASADTVDVHFARRFPTRQRKDA